jgi:hypothetical protein
MAEDSSFPLHDIHMRQSYKLTCQELIVDSCIFLKLSTTTTMDRQWRRLHPAEEATTTTTQ